MIIVRYYLPQLYIERSLSSTAFIIVLSSRSFKFPKYCNSKYCKKRKLRANDYHQSNEDISTNFVDFVLEGFMQTADLQAFHDIYARQSNNSSSDVIREVQEKLTIFQNSIKPLLKFAKRCGIDTQSNDIISFDDISEVPYMCQQNIVFAASSLVWNAGGSNSRFYIPQNSAFIWDDIRRGMRLLASCPQVRGHFKAVVCDPPWPNKSAKRGKKYQTSLSREDLLQLGEYISSITDATGSILAVWVTNNDDIIDFTRSRLLPAWGFRYITTWWWLKVNTDGQPVSENNPNSAHRKPYERIIIGFRGHQEVVGSDIGTDISMDYMCTCHCQNVDKADLLETFIFSRHGDTCPCHQKSTHELSNGFVKSESENRLPVDSEASLPSFMVDTQVLVSVPIRHSWKPSLHALLNRTLDYIRRGISNISPHIEEKTISDFDENQHANEKRVASVCEGSVVTEEETIAGRTSNVCRLGTDLELFAR